MTDWASRNNIDLSVTYLGSVDTARVGERHRHGH